MISILWLWKLYMSYITEIVKWNKEKCPCRDVMMRTVYQFNQYQCECSCKHWLAVNYYPLVEWISVSTFIWMKAHNTVTIPSPLDICISVCSRKQCWIRSLIEIILTKTHRSLWWSITKVSVISCFSNTVSVKSFLILISHCEAYLIFVS